MAVVNSSKYDQSVYGEYMLPNALVAGQVLWLVQVDWDNDGIIDGEIESQFIRSVKFSRGRKSRMRGDGRGQNHPEGESFSVDIYDPDGKYDVFNAVSSIYEKFGVPGLLARIMVINSTTMSQATPVFVGTLTGIDFDYESSVGTLSGTGLSRLMELGNASRVYAPCQNNSAEAWDAVFVPNTTAPYPINYWKGRTGGLTLDQCVAILMERMSWQLSYSVSSVGMTDQPDYFILDGQSGWESLKEIADGFAARVFFLRDGSLFVMDKGDFVGLGSVAPPTLGALRRVGLSRTPPFEALYNKAQTKVRPHFVPPFAWPVPTANYAVAWQNAGPIEVAPNSVVEILAEFDGAGVNKTFAGNICRVPTDSALEANPITVNSKADGTGVNMGASTGNGEGEFTLVLETVGTNDIGVIYRNKGNNQSFCTVKLQNWSATRTAFFSNLTVYVAGLRETGARLTTSVEDADSIADNGVREMEVNSRLIQTNALALSVGQALVEAVSTRNTASVVTVGYDARGDAAYDTLCGYDLGKFVDFGAAGGATAAKNFGIYGTNLVVGQEVEWVDTHGQNLLMRLTFEKQPGLAVALGSTSTGYVANGTTATVSHTVGTGDDRLLLVSIGIRSWFDVSGVTYGGVALTKLDSYALGYPTNGNFAKVEFWYLKNPASGTANVVVTMPGNEWVEVGVSDFANVDQVTPFGTVGKAKGSSPATSCSITVDATKYDLVTDVICTQGGIVAVTVGDDQTKRFGVSSDTNWQASGSTELGTRAGSTVMSWTLASVGYAAMAVAILAKNK